jgi:hypothetical protein
LFYVPKQKRKKLDYRATPGRCIGYSVSTKQYIVYDPLAKMLHHSRDEILREGKQYTAPNATDEAILNKHFYIDVLVEQTPTKKHSKSSQPIKKQPTKSQ